MATPRKLTTDQRGESYGLSGLQVKAAEMIVAGEGPVAVAKSIGVSRRSLTRWKEKPEFLRLCDELRAETIDRARAVLGGAAEQAARTLSGMLTGPIRKGASVRIAAAKDILDRVLGSPVKSDIRVAQVQGAQALILPDDMLSRLDRHADAIDGTPAGPAPIDVEDES